MNNKLCNKEQCTGCLVCKNVCPKDAISITRDFMGFSYPHIEQEKCVSCGICTKSCHILNPVDIEPTEKNMYRFAAGDELRKRSSSGGFVPLITEHCLALGYYICGVVFDDDFLSVKYIVTRDEKEISKMRKSKYVEADVSGVLTSIKQLLAAGESILFIGLPCHVAAVRKFVGNSEKLLTVDLICHGNGSPQFYAEGIKALCSEKNHSLQDIIGVDFRPKPEPAGKHNFKIDFVDDSVYMGSDDFPYYYGFNSRLILRDSCYGCKYQTKERVSDITTGDSTFCDNDLGENVVIGNTLKGKNFIDSLSDNAGFSELNQEEIKILLERFAQKVIPKNRQAIIKFKEYEKLKNTYLSNKYVPLKYKIKRKILNMIRR